MSVMSTINSARSLFSFLIESKGESRREERSKKRERREKSLRNPLYLYSLTLQKFSCSQRQKHLEETKRTSDVLSFDFQLSFIHLNTDKTESYLNATTSEFEWRFFNHLFQIFSWLVIGTDRCCFSFLFMSISNDDDLNNDELAKIKRKNIH